MLWKNSGFVLNEEMATQVIDETVMSIQDPMMRPRNNPKGCIAIRLPATATVITSVLISLLAFQQQLNDIEDYDQVDTIGYLVNAWLKYPKFGFARATDVSCYWIRSGKITREEGIKYVKEHDHKLDQKMLQDWLDFTGYKHREFWDIADKFYNRGIFEKVDGVWRLKNPIWKQEKKQP